MASASSQNASAAGLPKKGDKCDCHKLSFLEQSNCCEEGLVCDYKTWTCMPALGGKCERKWGATECANRETYAFEFGGGKLKCGHPNPHGESFCCIKSGEYAFFERPDRSERANLKPFRDPSKDCCSGRWKQEVHGSLMFGGLHAYAKCL
eukprot:Skav212207  [mRNA]  locus=scaffold754:789611:790060:+ [translate_table: standard]